MAFKREKRLTKKERQETFGKGPSGVPRIAGGPSSDGFSDPQLSPGTHIHCVACGKHLDPQDFEAPATATTITCDHGSTFPTCTKCLAKSTALVKEHDESNAPIRAATAWH